MQIGERELLKISTPQQEGVFHVSQLLKHQVLLEEEEMRRLFSFSFSLYNVSEIVSELEVQKEQFLEVYRAYLADLKRGGRGEDRLFRRFFSLALSTTPESLYAIRLKEEGYLIKLKKPVVQMQLHQFLFSSLDEKIHPMVLSQTSIPWGLQFSYPQIFQYPKPVDGKTFVRTRLKEEFPNTALFHEFVKWFRLHTVPVTFLKEGKKIATSLRLGKECMSWISDYIHLKTAGLAIS